VPGLFSDASFSAASFAAASRALRGPESRPMRRPVRSPMRGPIRRPAPSRPQPPAPALRRLPSPPPRALLLVALLAAAPAGFPGAGGSPLAAQERTTQERTTSERTVQERATQDLELLPRPSVRITRAVGPVVLDGRLDEAAWQGLEPITEFVQAEPNAGAPPSERTEVWIVYDDKHLYIAARMWESEPDRLVTGGMERDVPGILMEEMDSFGVTLDPFLDRRSSFIFFVNPVGGLKDGQGAQDGRTRDYGWNGVVDARTTIDDEGWTVEMAIPWRTLRYDPSVEEPVWGLNLSRRIRRRNEVSYWAPLDRRNRIFLMSRAGTLTGMTDLPRARNLNVKPFTLASHSGGGAIPEEARGPAFDGGLDVKWGLTPSLTLDLTWRTDFSQVEVDQQQVNLTRFPVFFPELREFFLENSGTFSFGDLEGGPGGPRLGTSLRDFTLFHSRQIGLRAGRPVPLLGGGRITGRTAGLEVGLLNVQSEAFEGRLAENFSVVRLRRDLSGNSNVGFIFTSRDPLGGRGGGGPDGRGPAGRDPLPTPGSANVAPPTPQPANRAVGVDANLRFGGSLWVNSYVALTENGADRDQAARLSVGWRDPFWNGSASYRRIGEDFNPGVGFIRRTGIHQGYATLGVHHRPQTPRIQEIAPYVETTRILDLGGRLESASSRAVLGVTLPDRSSLNLSWNREEERLSAPFRIRPGTSIPVGDYGFSQVALNVRSSQGRALSGNAGVSGGGFYDGRRLALSGGLRWQPDHRLILDMDATYNDLEVQDSRFTADLYSLRAQVATSNVLSFTGFVQYNGDADEITSNLRLNYIHAPLSDIFLLYTERRGAGGGAGGAGPGGGGAAVERFLTLKVTRLLAF
jgi:hypothetical protein